MNLVEKAELFATVAHAAVGQKRKYTGEPYIVHPRAVVELLRLVTDDENILAGGWLHDVVEDTKVTNEMIEQHFGWYVASLVSQVTDVSKPEDGNRATRKRIDREYIAGASSDAQTIKLADLIDNSQSIIARDPEFAKIYIPEKVALLLVLKRGNDTLWNLAAGVVSASPATLGKDG